MPPRYAYWTILVDGGPTAFRAAEPDELLPTLERLQVKQPDAVMKWFEKQLQEELGLRADAAALREPALQA